MVYCTSDIHNDSVKLQLLLEKVMFDFTKDHLYILGDVFDRGPDPYGCINIIKRLEKKKSVDLILGNHDMGLALYIRSQIDNPRKRQYYYNTYDLIRDKYTDYELLDLADWILSWSLQKELVVNGERFLLAHAATSEKPQDESYYTMNFDFPYEDDTERNYISVVGHNATPLIFFSRGIHKGAEIYYSRSRKTIDIDTGNQTCSGGRLSALRLEDYKEYYV